MGRREANREIRRRNRTGVERRERTEWRQWRGESEREGGREIIQGHNQRALVYRLRVRGEEGDFTDSVISKEDAAARKEHEDKEVQEKDTSLIRS